jgi:aspartyl-tRNA(Asn)/glutamyl-tRNA(Gln) amidotransferase subunit A
MSHESSVSRRDFVLTGLAAVAGSALPASSFAQTAAGRFAFAQATADKSAQSRDLTALTLKQASDLVRRRGVSPVELVEACLKRIDALDPLLNAFVTVARDEALAAARELEAEVRRNGWRGPLHGIPVAFKDNIDTAGIRTTGASALFTDRIPGEDAVAVARLKHAGAIVLGKLNLHEFALGGTSAVTHFGPVRNPWAPDHHPGGSSGGNAAAVAADLCFGTLGTDTGGSIRIPAAYCGIVGLKPTAGRVSNRGVIPNSWTFDTVGPMCKTVEDAALMLGVIAGYDEQDPTSVDAPVGAYAREIRTRTSRLRVGIPRTPFYEGLDSEVAGAVETALEVITGIAGGVREVQLPASPGLMGVASAEIYAYHAPWITKTPELYQEATRRIVLGGADARPEVYIEGLRRVEIARREIARVFASVDLLVMPTTGGVASRLPDPASAPTSAPGPGRGGRGGGGGGGGAAGFGNTSYFSFYGLPAVSVPCGFTAAGLPIGLQIGGAPFAEGTVLALAHAYEQATEWHRRQPALEG